MALNVSEIGFQNTSLEQRNTQAVVAAFFSSELSLRTQDGDLVNLSFDAEQSLSESHTQTLTQDNGTVQQFSSVARAAASYSLTIQGDLNEEELAAINKLAAEIAPLAREFFASGELNLEDAINVLANNLGVIQQVELALERTVVATFETRSISRLPEEAGYINDIGTLDNQASELETDGIRDFPALVQATIDAVFESEAKQIPEHDLILRSLKDLLDFIRNQLGEFFNPPTGLAALPVESATVTDGAIDIGDGLEHALAQITALVAITQFQRFARTGGGAGGCAGAAHDAAFQNHIRLDGRIAARVQNLTSLDINDFCHLYLLAPYIESIG